MFSRIRNSLGKRNTFARVIEINKSMGSISSLSTLPVGKSTFFTGLHLINALATKYPFTAPICTVDTIDSSLMTSSPFQEIEKKQGKHFSNIKEIIIPCSTTKFSVMEEVQSKLLELFDARVFDRKLHGIYEVDLDSSEKVILRTAPTNVCSVVLKVDDLEAASTALRSLNALGDSFGRNGTSQNSEIQIKMSLDEGVEFRITDSNMVSPFYSEPPDSMLADERPEMQSTRVQTEGGGGERVIVPENVLVGDCWSEVKVHLTSKKAK